MTAPFLQQSLVLPNPCRVENFHWHNMGLTNVPLSPNEYPVEFLYREILSKDQLLEALSFFLIRVPKCEADEEMPERGAFTILPRYHQSHPSQKRDHILETGYRDASPGSLRQHQLQRSHEG